MSDKKAKKLYSDGNDVIFCYDKEVSTKSTFFSITFSKERSWKEVLVSLDKESNKKRYYFDQGDYFQIEKIKNKSILHIKDKFYDGSDFDEIRKIICEQNEVEMIDENTRKEVRDELEKAQYRANKIRGSEKMCDFENQLICISISTGFKLKEVNNLTLRKFVKYIARINHKMTYEIFKPAILSGNVTSKNKNFPSFWMADLESDNKYADILIDEEEIKNKIEN